MYDAEYASTACTSLTETVPPVTVTSDSSRRGVTTW